MLDATYCKPGDEMHEAAWNPEEGEVTVIRSRWAGISGPAGSYPATSLTEAAQALFAAGYLVSDAWEQGRYNGTCWTRITPMS